MPIDIDANEFLWAQKYRPQKVDDCIIPERTKKQIKDFIATGEIPHLMFAGTGGIGKTTLARAIANELNADVLFVNASMDNGIDEIRTTLKQFASTVSFGGGTKIILLDEAEQLSQSAQMGMRAFFEEFSANCRFILTCNHKEKIIEPLHSRCTMVDFTIPVAERATMAGQMYNRVLAILDENKVTYDDKVVRQLIKKCFPDFRRTLNELQRYSIGGSVDVGILASISDESFTALITSLKEKNFPVMRKWVSDNVNLGLNGIYRRIYNALSEVLEPASVPEAILIIRDYMANSASVADEEINISAFLITIMMSCKFKE